MFKYLKWTFIVILVAAAGIFLLSQIGRSLVGEVTEEVKVEKREDPEAALTGKGAPYFELQNLSGEAIKITDFLGNAVLLTFWTTWNQNSLDQLKIFDDYVMMKGESLFKVIAVNSQEDRSVVSSFISRGGYGIRILLDENGAVTEKYRARNLPVTFFIDKDGIIKNVLVGVADEEEILNTIEGIIK